MTDEEKKEYEELKRLLYQGTLTQYGKRELIGILEKQSKEIEQTKYIKRSFDYCIAVEKKKLEDKIKAKIEVLEKLQKEFPNNDEIRIKIIAYKELLEKE